jgi:hypothetical protein
MAPEQALAHWDEVDGRTDLWALGATMFTLLSGKVVHEAQTGNEQLVQSATKPARSLATVTKLPPAYVAIVDRALQFKKEHRWPDAKSMQTAIRQLRASLAAAQAPRSSLPQMEAVHAKNSFPALDVSALQQQARAELEAQTIDAAQLAASHAELQRRAAAARQRVTDLRARIAATKSERDALDKQFKAQTETRASAAEESRKQHRAALAAFGRAVVHDVDAFGGPFAAVREEVRGLMTVADAAAKDANIHRAALVAYDKKTVTRGIAVVVALAFVALVLFFLPVILRFAAD